jgi:acetyltransferase-like isoleucine patch superfamily enzyme
MSLKFIFKYIYILIHKYTFGLFYDSKYLKGRRFDNSLVGWKWVRRCFFTQKILGDNRHIPWPCSNNVHISNPKKIFFDIDDIGFFQGFGKYFQCINGNIYLGKGSFIARNVGIITTNHDFHNLAVHTEGKDVIIGERCWIGMNAIILPGVVLGEKTIVGAGSVVTKSFSEGNCVIAGNPAKVIKKI